MSRESYTHDAELLEAAVDRLFSRIRPEHLPLTREMFCRFIETDEQQYFFVVYYPDTQQHAEVAVELVRTLIPFVWGVAEVRGYGAAPNRKEGRPIICKVLGRNASAICRTEIEEVLPSVKREDHPHYCHLLLLELTRLILCHHFEKEIQEELVQNYERGRAS